MTTTTTPKPLLRSLRNVTDEDLLTRERPIKRLMVHLLDNPPEGYHFTDDEGHHSPIQLAAYIHERLNLRGSSAPVCVQQWADEVCEAYDTDQAAIDAITLKSLWDDELLLPHEFYIKRDMRRILSDDYLSGDGALFEDERVNCTTLAEQTAHALDLYTDYIDWKIPDVLFDWAVDVADDFERELAEG